MGRPPARGCPVSVLDPVHNILTSSILATFCVVVATSVPTTVSASQVSDLHK